MSFGENVLGCGELRRKEVNSSCIEVSCVCDQILGAGGTTFLPNDCQVTKFRAVLCG